MVDQLSVGFIKVLKLTTAFIFLVVSNIMGQVDHWETLVYDTATWRYVVPNASASMNWIQLDSMLLPGIQGMVGLGLLMAMMALLFLPHLFLFLREKNLPFQTFPLLRKSFLT